MYYTYFAILTYSKYNIFLKLLRIIFINNIIKIIGVYLTFILYFKRISFNLIIRRF